MTDRDERALLRLFGRSVRERRERAGWSQEQLGTACGLHRTYIGGVERGERNPTLLSAERVARALGSNLVQLLGRARGRADREASRKRG